MTTTTMKRNNDSIVYAYHLAQQAMRAAGYSDDVDVEGLEWHVDGDESATTTVARRPRGTRGAEGARYASVTRGEAFTVALAKAIDALHDTHHFGRHEIGDEINESTEALIVEFCVGAIHDAARKIVDRQLAASV